MRLVALFAPSVDVFDLDETGCDSRRLSISIDYYAQDTAVHLLMHFQRRSGSLCGGEVGDRVGARTSSISRCDSNFLALHVMNQNLSVESTGNRFPSTPNESVEYDFVGRESAD